MTKIILAGFADNTNSPFNEIRGFRADGTEYWTGRELMRFLGYSKWEYGEKGILRAIKALVNQGLDTTLHVLEYRKDSRSNGLGVQQITDYELSRFACYLVAMNSDPDKEIVALAQGYFANSTYQQEIAQQPAELSRLEILQLALASEQEKLLLLAQIETDRPATELGKAIGKSAENIRIGDFAKVIGVGQNRYFKELRECKIIMAASTLPYQRFMEAGYFVATEIVVNNHLYPVALITPKGQAYLTKRHRQHVDRELIECQLECAIDLALV